MAMPKADLKISSMQYKSLLSRIVERQAGDATTGMMQQMGMDPQAAQMMQGDIPVPQPNPMPMISPLPDQTQTTPVSPTPVSSPATAGSPAENMNAALQAWMTIKGGVGEQLWSRLAQFSADAKGAKNPEGFFVQEAMKYLQNPMNVADQRVRKFLEGVLGQQGASAPSTANILAGLVQ